MDNALNTGLASFASYLDASGPGQTAERARQAMGTEAFEALRARWSGRILTPTTRPEEIEAALGPPPHRDAHALAYDLPRRPGYHYVFEFDPAWTTLKRTGFRRVGSVPPPPTSLHIAAYKQALIDIGATAFELDEWLGSPADRYGWWPEEVFDYANGLSVRLRHGVVEADSA